MAFVEIAHVASLAIGGDAINGALSADVNVDQPRKADGGADGAAWESAQSKATGDVTGTVVFADVAGMLAALAHAEGNLVIVGTPVGGGSNVTVTCKNAAFFTLDSDLPDRSGPGAGENTLMFGCVSTDGNIPLTVV